MGPRVAQELPSLLHRLDEGPRRGLQVCGRTILSKLEGNRGEIAIFCVQGARFIPENPYPKAHTCFNRLELPEYPTRELMSEYMSATLSEQLEGQFGLE